jgi:hypothetical protein
VVWALNDELASALPTRAIPESKRKVLQLRLEASLLQQIDKYRLGAGRLTRPAAIRKLISRGLESESELPPQDKDWVIMLLRDLIDQLTAETSRDTETIRANAHGRPASP